MQLSIRASLAIHCLILVSEFGETDKITSEKDCFINGNESGSDTQYHECFKKMESLM